MSTQPTPPDDYTSIEVDRIPVGTILQGSILDDRDVLLLAEGQTVTEPFLQKLRDRKVGFVRVQDRDVVRLAAVDPQAVGRPAGTAVDAPPEHGGFVSPHRNESSDRLDAEVALGRTQAPAPGEPLLPFLRKPARVAYDPTTRERMIENYGRSTQRMCRVYDRLSAGKGVDRGSMEEIASDAVSDLTEDADLFAGIAANVPGGTDYPARHSVHVAQLGMAIGVRLGLDSSTLRELILGCLVHDAGMLLVDRAVFDGPHILDRISFLEITKHPIYVFDMLKDLGTMPKRSAFIAYQIHERVDGSGYPRRRSGTQIHFLSKVAAVADTYVALVSARPHRPAMMPYHAMERLLRDAGRGLFDRDAVRSLLRTLSLFPIGSYVELSDGRQARVLRSGDEYTKPLVEIAGPSDLPPVLVDLAAEGAPTVARPIPVLTEASG